MVNGVVFYLARLNKGSLREGDLFLSNLYVLPLSKWETGT